MDMILAICFAPLTNPPSKYYLHRKRGSCSFGEAAWRLALYTASGAALRAERPAGRVSSRQARAV